MRPAYYNEIDPYAAQTLRNLIAAGLIAPGDVDERSIEDVRPDDLLGYTQCHFFAGIGVWSYALRRAGWPDDAPVWTGSCPCQPFSQAGEGKGFADERHLWPAWQHLIRERRPPAILGEQVASADADPWIDLVHTDLEPLGYAFGTVPFPSAGVGAPHIRDRIYWGAVRLGHADGQRAGWLSGAIRGAQAGHGGRHGGDDAQPPGAAAVGLAHIEGRGLGELGRPLEPGDVRHADGGGDAPSGMADTHGSGAPDPSECLRPGEPESGGDSESVRLADPAGPGLGIIGWGGSAGQGHPRPHADQHHQGNRPGPLNGFWRTADWLLCRDGRWRPVEPGTFPLAHGAPARVGRLRAYGNAINAEQAVAFIESFIESLMP